MIKTHVSSYIWTNLESGYLVNGVHFLQQIKSANHTVACHVLMPLIAAFSFICKRLEKRAFS